MQITLKWDGGTGDGKRAFVVAKENDGWKDLRIEVDTDDVDSKHAMKAMREVIRRCNAANKPKESVKPPIVIPTEMFNHTVKFMEGLDSIMVDHDTKVQTANFTHCGCDFCTLVRNYKQAVAKKK